MELIFFKNKNIFTFDDSSLIAFFISFNFETLMIVATLKFPLMRYS